MTDPITEKVRGAALRVGMRNIRKAHERLNEALSTQTLSNDDETKSLYSLIEVDGDLSFSQIGEALALAKRISPRMAENCDLLYRSKFADSHIEDAFLAWCAIDEVLFLIGWAEMLIRSSRGNG